MLLTEFSKSLRKRSKYYEVMVSVLKTRGQIKSIFFC